MFTRLEPQPNIDYKNEIIRKAIHLNSLSIPVIYFFINKELALWILIPLTLSFLFVDIVRYINPQVGTLFYKIFGFLLRKHEKDEKKKRLNGATNLLISAVICVLVFPKLIVVTAFSILIISDSTSALIGRKFGRHKFFNKSLEGSLAFFLSAVVVILFTPKVEYIFSEYLIGFLAALVGTIIESISLEIDDNISVPVSIGLSLWLFYYLFLPKLNVFILG